MKTILHATDFSANAAAALKYAHFIARCWNGQLCVLHVFDDPTLSKRNNPPPPQLVTQTFDEQKDKLEKYCKEHIGLDKASEYLTLIAVENRSAVKGIIEKLHETAADLVVVGMTGRSNLKELIMGSITRQLIVEAPCPVLCIPEVEEVLPNIKTIVYATDFETEDIEAILKIVELARPAKAKIHVVHIATEKEYAGEIRFEGFKQMLKKKADYDHLDTEVVLSVDIFDSLRSYMNIVGADLVVMLEREKKGIGKKVFHRDLIKKMESYGKIPLLSFNETLLQDA